MLAPTSVYLHADNIQCSDQLHQQPRARLTEYLTTDHKISYFKFIVRSTYDSDLKRARISLRNTVTLSLTILRFYK